MSLQFVIGASGSGKSTTIYKEIIRQSMADPQGKYLILVPEQFTMQTQKEMVELHPRKGIMNIDVLSFQRLSYHVFDDHGGLRKTILEDTGKSLIIRKLAQEHEDELTVLKGRLNKVGYVTEMTSVLSELTQYRITSKMLLDMAEKKADQPILCDKLKDICTISDAFAQYKADKMITSEELLEELASMLDDSERLKDAVIVLDGYTGFTPIQYLLLTKIFRLAKKVYVTVTMDPALYPFTTIREEELFALSKETIRELRHIADEVGVCEEEPLLLCQGQDENRGRFVGREELQFLEKHLLRYDGAVYGKSAKRIRITAEQDPETEIRSIAGQIRKLTQTKGYRYKDIAVITGDMAAYAPYAEREFAAAGIPCFMDYSRSILANSFVEFLRAALKLVEERFTSSAVFRYLHTGLSGLSIQEADLLKEYVTALGIRGYAKYEVPFTKRSKAMKEEELEQINEIRERFISPLKEFVKACPNKKTPVVDRTTALYDLCDCLEAETACLRLKEHFAENHEEELAREYGSVFEKVCELFDKYVELLGDEELSLKEYAQILDAGFEEVKVGIIPPGQDQVVMGDIERSRLAHIRILFVVGVNDGIIPSVKGRKGILSTLDREQLKELHLPLAPDMRENAYTQQFYLYQNLTKASDGIMLSYSMVNRSGEALRPSYLVGMLKDMFPRHSDEKQPEAVLSRERGWKILAGNIRDNAGDPKDNIDLAMTLAEDPKGEELLQSISRLYEENHSELYLDKAVASALYGEEWTGSVTRLEQYAACAYAHFLTYGLRVKETQEFEYAATDVGVILHKALELYAKKMDTEGYSWKDITPEEQNMLIDRCVDEASANYGNDIFKKDARSQHMLTRIRKMAKKSVWALTLQIRRGDFVPEGFETDFGNARHLDSITIALEDGTVLHLTGKIDRTDICKEEDKVFVKIIDYKTGSKSFSVSDVEDGLSLQLPVYLSVSMDIQKRTNPDKEIVPAAMLYYEAKDPILSGSKMIRPADAEAATLKELKPNGLVNSSEEVIERLDVSKGTDYPVIPVTFNKDGSISVSKSSVATEEEFKRIMDRTYENIRSFAQEIANGDIRINPYKKREREACEYCKYKPICGFDPRRRGHKFRELGKQTVGEEEQK